MSDLDQLIAEAREKTAEKRWAFPMFGVECGKGWKELYGPLFQLCKLLNVEVHQVKEKFGGLRFYTGGCPAEHSDMLLSIIDALEHLSYSVCEECGIQNNHYYKGKYDAPAKVTTSGSWLRTLCESCRVAQKLED